jgi:hypothetical protein
MNDENSPQKRRIVPDPLPSVKESINLDSSILITSQNGINFSQKNGHSKM